MLDIGRYIKAKNANAVKIEKMPDKINAIFSIFDQDTAQEVRTETQAFTVAELEQQVVNIEEKKKALINSFNTQVEELKKIIKELRKEA